MYEIHNQPIRKANDCAITQFDQSEILLNDSTSEYRATRAALCKKETRGRCAKICVFLRNNGGLLRKTRKLKYESKD